MQSVAMTLHLHHLLLNNYITHFIQKYAVLSQFCGKKPHIFCSGDFAASSTMKNVLTKQFISDMVNYTSNEQCNLRHKLT